MVSAAIIRTTTHTSGEHSLLLRDSSCVLSHRRKVSVLPYNHLFRRHVPDMSLEQDYEKDSNPSSHSKDPSQGLNDSQQKQRPKSLHSAFEHEDAVLSEKKDRPPRFSTVFANPTPPVPYRDDDPPRERKRSGVFVPVPLFILFAALLLLMSTFLFAYTIIGLYNNRPAGLLSQPSPINGYDCAGFKFAPNFLLGDAKATVTVTAGEAVLPQAQTEVKKSPSPSSTKLVVVTPKPIVVSSTAIVAVNQNGKTITPSSSKSTSTSKSQSTDKGDGKDAQKVKKDTTAVVPASTHEKQSTAVSAKPTSKTTKKEKDKVAISTTSAKDAKDTDACANQIDNGGSPHLILNCARKV